MAASATTQASAQAVGAWRFDEGVANGAATGAGSVLDSVGAASATPTSEPTNWTDVPVLLLTAAPLGPGPFHLAMLKDLGGGLAAGNGVPRACGGLRAGVLRRLLGFCRVVHNVARGPAGRARRARGGPGAVTRLRLNPRFHPAASGTVGRGRWLGAGRRFSPVPFAKARAARARTVTCAGRIQP